MLAFVAGVVDIVFEARRTVGVDAAQLVVGWFAATALLSSATDTRRSVFIGCVPTSGFNIFNTFARADNIVLVPKSLSNVWQNELYFFTRKLTASKSPYS